MQTRSNIFLIGLMGVGKTTIGKALADELRLQFYDSDQEIEARAGADIPWIFDLEGEVGFRLREKKMVEELSGLQGIVLATGGGVVLNADNRQILKNRGVVIYLKADIDDLLSRTLRNQNRPLLANNNPKETLEKLLSQREPLYIELADFVYDTSETAIPDIVKKIIKDLRERKYF